jgi:TPR repeat protein
MAGRNTVNDKRNFDRTIKEARIGHRESQYEAALMYANGVGVAQDLTQAIHWVRQSAERGFAPAQYLLATRFSAGEVVAQDDHQALKWLIKAADQDHPKAIYKLARFYSTTHTRAAGELCQVAANAGVPQAQLEVATEILASRADAASAEEAFLWCKKAAEQGVATAQCALADRYARGEGVAQDIAQAYAWYRKAARQYHIAAQVTMSQLDEQGLGRVSAGRSSRPSGAADRRRDAQRWNQAGDVGDATAKYSLGLMYQNGWGVAQDEAQSRAWFEAAAQSGHVSAQLAVARRLEAELNFQQAFDLYEKVAALGDSDACAALGRFYWLGLGCTKDDFLGLAWTMKASEMGQSEALMNLGEWAASESQRIIHACLFRAAHAGSSVAQCAVGLKYCEGNDMPKEMMQARDWFIKAAEQGDAKAQWNLALMLISGTEGVKKDLKKAFTLCQQSALQGFVPAQASLGILYARMKKPDKAVEWWRVAAEQGDPEAQFNLAVALSKGLGVVQDSALAVAWLARAAEQGVANAQSKLGLLYATGDGVAMDPVEAHKWFVIASQNGDKAAQANVEHSRLQLDPVQVVEANLRAHAWLGTFKSIWPGADDPIPAAS